MSPTKNKLTIQSKRFWERTSNKTASTEPCSDTEETWRDETDVIEHELHSAGLTGFQYESIPSFNKYSDLTRDKNYVRLPSDWFVIVTDIEGSTRYIEQGRYRDVNTVGAMSIAGVRNALPQREIPYVFGGDGASMVVRPDQYEEAVTALLALQRLVKIKYGMKLRVGTVQIADLEMRGVRVEVARYEIAAGLCIAMFRGGGLALADTIVKSTGGLEQTELSQDYIPCMDGLSCRWEKIPNQNGCILAVLVMNNGANDMSMYTHVLQRIDAMLDDDHNPVNIRTASYRSAFDMLQDEVRMHRSSWSLSFLSRAREIFLCVVLFRWKRLQQSVFDVASYIEDIRTHADYRKFDDMIRMVVDCTEEQADGIEAVLRDLYEDSRHVFYGTQRSNNVLITCMLEDTSPGQHIHFVDGDLGGYAIAAKVLKTQLEKALFESHGEC